MSQRSWFRGRVVLVTGGSRGLGLAMSRRLVDVGARLVICGRDQDQLEAARAELTVDGAEVLAVPCDVGDRDAVVEMINRTVAEFSHVDALIYNAGIITVGPVGTQRVEDYEEAMRVMFFGLVNTTLAVLPMMRRSGDGRITNITSIGGKLSFPHLLPYNSAKFAAVGFSEGLRAELAGTGIEVTTVVPGLMRTGSHPHALLVLSPQAKLASRFAGAFPGLTARALSVAGRLLPSADDGSPETRTGAQSRRGISALLTSTGQPAARRFRQIGDRD